MAETQAQVDVQEGEGPGLGLLDLPTSVLHHVFQLIVGGSICDPAGGAVSNSTGSGSTVAAAGTPRDIVHLAFSCKAMLDAVEAADQLWQQQCRRLGWRYVATVPGNACLCSCRLGACAICVAVSHVLPRQIPLAAASPGWPPCRQVPPRGPTSAAA